MTVVNANANVNRNLTAKEQRDMAEQLKQDGVEVLQGYPDLQDEISKIKMKTLAHQPFFGAGASKLLWVADKQMKTAATDGTSIKFNPDFLMSLSSKQQVGLVVHEILHVYGKHHIRGIGLDHNLHNIATDYWINLQIQDAIEAEIRRRGVSCMELPEGALLDEKYRGMSSDDIYKLLLKEQKQPDVNPRRTKTPQQPSEVMIMTMAKVAKVASSSRKMMLNLPVTSQWMMVRSRRTGAG